MSETERGKPISDERTLRDQLVAAGTAAAEQWLSKRANRRMSDVNRKRLAGHVVNALWQQIEQATVEIAQWIAEDDRAELARVRTELAARIAAESADAAAGSYVGRACVWPACLTETQQVELSENVRRSMLGEGTGLDPEPDCDCTERLQAKMARLTAELAHANSTVEAFHQTADELSDRYDAMRADWQAATARAEQAEAALAEMREAIATNLDRQAHLAAICHVDGETCLEAVTFARAAQLARNADATPRTALERAADEQGEREGHGPNALGGRCRNDTSGSSRA